MKRMCKLSYEELEQIDEAGGEARTLDIAMPNRIWELIDSAIAAGHVTEIGLSQKLTTLLVDDIQHYIEKGCGDPKCPEHREHGMHEHREVEIREIKLPDALREVLGKAIAERLRVEGQQKKRDMN